MPLWYLPIRFFNTLWQDDLIAPVYCLLTLFGGWIAWKKHGVLGRMLVLWFVVLYLTYSCFPQSIWPWRPLIRDADRFLCGLAVPMALLSGLGLVSLFQVRWVGERRWARWLIDRPVVAAALGLAFFLVTTSREFFHLDYVPRMRAYIAERPPGTKVLTHRTMRAIAFLMNSSAAARLEWLIADPIMEPNAGNEKLAGEAGEFWYARKLIWLTSRKKVQKKLLAEQTALPSYFASPGKDWHLNEVLVRGDAPDLVFYQRRQPGAPPPVVLTASSPEFQGVVPPLPAEWTPTGKNRVLRGEFNIPPDLRGKLVRVELEAAANEVESCALQLRFRGNDKLGETLRLKPYLYPEPGQEFFVLPIPAEATKAAFSLMFSRSARSVRFLNFRVLADPRPAPAPH
jgi:hypothetical protein